MRWRRETYLDLLTFGDAPRPMFSELFGPLVGLDAEWRAQGATEAEIAMTAFDWDYVPYVDCGGDCGPRGPAPVVVSDTPDERVQHDFLGRTLRLLKHSATIPLPSDFPVESMDDWLRVKPHFEFTPARIDWDRVEAARRAQASGTLVVAYLPGAFDTPRELMGEEAMCLAYYEEPELMADILATLQDTALRVLEPISEKLTIDVAMWHEDFAGKSGPMVGPAQVAQCFQPYYRSVVDLLSSRGTRVFEQDTDGNINPVIPALLDCGLNSLYPMEPAAGMDIVAVRREYGQKLAVRGGIDKHVLRDGREAIRRELEHKLLDPDLRAGGCVFGLDHRIPNGTPLADYRYYVELGREMLDLPPLDPTRTGWGRMAL